jgi:hypothetical protein
MSTTTTITTQIPRGVYRLIVAGGGAFESDRLTDAKYVTVLPSSVDVDAKQKVVHHSS